MKVQDINITLAEGWEEQPPPPVPSFLKKFSGQLRAFFHPGKEIGVNLSVEDKMPPHHIHLSVRHNGGISVTDEEMAELLAMFFPGATIAKNMDEVKAGAWVERKGVGMVKTVRHFSKFL